MASHDNSKASASAIKNANNMWENFTKISTVCGIITGITLTLMAIFLV